MNSCRTEEKKLNNEASCITGTVAGIGQKLKALQKVRRLMATYMEDWVDVSNTYKSFAGEQCGEEWIVGAVIIRQIDMYIMSLKEIKKHGTLRLNFDMESDRIVIRTFPRTEKDAKYSEGISAKTYIKKGMSPFIERVEQSSLKNEKKTVILGAGNLSSMITQDILHYLIVEDSVVIYKFNPVNEYLKPLLEKIFEPFINLKLLSVVKGNKDAGRELISKEDVDIIHFTGSAHNYQSVRETSGRKELRTALGNITPLIIPPADWTRKELFQQASHIVFMFTNNSCLNCATPKILITQKNWKHREKLLATIQHILSEKAQQDELFSTIQHITRRFNPYSCYPGTVESYKKALVEYPKHISIDRDDKALPWTIITDLHPDIENRMIFQEELFCPIIGDLTINTDDEIEFMEKAVSFANTELWGNLCAAVIAPPGMANTKSFRETLFGLEYGTIGINIWPAVSLANASTPWGAYPSGNSASGCRTCFTNNPLFLKNTEKSIIEGPFTPQHIGWSTSSGYLDFARNMNILACKSGRGKLSRFKESMNIMFDNAANLAKQY